MPKEEEERIEEGPKEDPSKVLGLSEAEYNDILKKLPSLGMEIHKKIGHDENVIRYSKGDRSAMSPVAWVTRHPGSNTYDIEAKYGELGENYDDKSSVIEMAKDIRKLYEEKRERKEKKK